MKEIFMSPLGYIVGGFMGAYLFSKRNDWKQFTIIQIASYIIIVMLEYLKIVLAK